MTLAEVDRFDVRRARSAPAELAPFNEAGVLAAADVHVARRLGELAGAGGALLAAALAVRAPRLGHVYVDLSTVASTVTVEAEEPVDLGALPWPSPGEWVARVAASPLVSVGEDDAESRPLRLVGSRLYLDRYWREERQVASDLRALSEAADGIDTALLAEGLGRVFAGRPDRGQQLAAASAVLRRFAVVAGGPGTGKTTTIARILALLYEQPGDRHIALAAPTNTAARRLEAAIRKEAADLDVSPSVRALIVGAPVSTVHRLLGRRPDSSSRFRHHRGNKLPHDVVIVDETSMVPLSRMGRLLEALRPTARLILVGDPGQLTSIEAGAVLGDIVGPATRGLRMRPEARARLAEVTGEDVQTEPGGASIGDGVVVLDHGHRFGTETEIAALEGAVRRGDPDEVMEVLARRPKGVEWIAEDPATHPLPAVRAAAVKSGRAILTAAAQRDAATALEALHDFRVLCAHRRGEHGVATWMTRIEGWLADDVEGFTSGRRWYVGRPLLVTENDYELGLFNGDTGVVVATAQTKVAAAFERRGEIVELSPSRLAAVDTVYAMTIHKSQGSQFGAAAVLLPPASSPILTRELLYTAVTRAQDRLIVVGTEETLRAAVARPATRASGLRERLWEE